MTMTDIRQPEATGELREALQEQNEENLGLQDKVAELECSQRLLIRVAADLAAKLYPDGITAERGDKPGWCDLIGQLYQLLDAGYRVEFSKEPEGYVATADDHAAGVHDAVADSPDAALAALAAVISGGPDTH